MKLIQWIDITNNVLRFKFADGTDLYLHDDAQSCCEHRYMTCDDDLEYYVGAEYISWEVQDANDYVEDEDSYSTHEVQFLIITTSKGVFTVANHNVHNGYYGGFSIREIN